MSASHVSLNLVREELLSSLKELTPKKPYATATNVPVKKLHTLILQDKSIKKSQPRFLCVENVTTSLNKGAGNFTAK